MSDLVVTVPKALWPAWIAEGDAYRWLLPRIAGVLQDHGRDAFPRVDERPNVKGLPRA